MEEAGDKMEGNIDEIKITYSQRMQKLEDIIKKVSSFRRYIAPSFDLDSSNLFFQLIVSKETLTKNSQLSRKHVQDLQTNLSKLLETNDALNSDLQTASKTIVRINIVNDECFSQLNHISFQVELEMKLKAYEKLIACEQATAK